MSSYKNLAAQGKHKFCVLVKPWRCAFKGYNMNHIGDVDDMMEITGNPKGT
jgi:hypothetical protein